jgi:hypothetical protein
LILSGIDFQFIYISYKVKFIDELTTGSLLDLRLRDKKYPGAAQKATHYRYLWDKMPLE